MKRSWVAMKDGIVTGFIPMPIFVDNDKFNIYREKARKILDTLGEVKTGVVIERDGKKVFQKNTTHKNRGKSERTVQEYMIESDVKAIKITL